MLKRPLLIVPPWINKFYVLDLNPDKSFIRWAVSPGPDGLLHLLGQSRTNGMPSKGFEHYMREGIFAALDAIKEATGEKKVTAIGYCVGGTLLAVALAYMAAKRRQADRQRDLLHGAGRFHRMRATSRCSSTRNRLRPSRRS